MKTALKRKNDEFLVLPLKRVLSVMDLINHSGTQNLWAIEKKCSPSSFENGKIFGARRRGDPYHLDLVLLPLLAHENGAKTQKRRVFGHASQTCTECHGPCKSLRNPKTVGNSS
jgi:hypothetical protein